jgi:hypothetical protein
MARPGSQNTNLASEFYVASQLFRLGYTVTLTLGHTKEIDLIVAHPDGRTCTIDVKGLKNTTNWPLKPKLVKEDHFFVLVSYRNKFTALKEQPDIFVIPSQHVKQLLSKWSGKPDVTCIGYKNVKNSRFKDAWHLLFK